MEQLEVSITLTIASSFRSGAEERSRSVEINNTLAETPQEQQPQSVNWQPLDLEAAIREQLAEIRDRAEANAVERLELRRELRMVGR